MNTPNNEPNINGAQTQPTGTQPSQPTQPKNAAQLEGNTQSMTFGAPVPNPVRQGQRTAAQAQNRANMQAQNVNPNMQANQLRRPPIQGQTPNRSPQVPPSAQNMQNTQTMTFTAQSPNVRQMPPRTMPPQNTQNIPITRPAGQPNGKPKKNSAKKKRGRKLLIAGLAALLTIIVIAAVGVSLVLFYEPDADENVPFNTAPADNVQQQNGDTPTIDFGKAPEQQSGKYTRRKGVYNFLVAGLDAEGGNHTDVLLVVSYDTVNGSAAVLSIPRDTYINVGRNFSKLNSYYTGEYNVAVKNGLRGGNARKAAMDGLCSLLEENLAIKLDYWAMMDLEGFRNIVDIFGGVEIEIAEDMYYDDPFQNLHIDLKAGRQTLTGEQAEQFVRFREGYKQADKGRINAQKIFITAFLDTVKRNISIGMIDDLIGEASENVLTSINVLDCVYFAKMALTTLDLSGIYMVTLPSDGVQNPTTGAWYEVMYRADALSIINEYFNVYDREITDDIFDRERVFTNTELSYIDKVYDRESGTAESGQSADDIGESSVDMLRDAFLDDYLDK